MGTQVKYLKKKTITIIKGRMRIKEKYTSQTEAKLPQSSLIRLHGIKISQILLT